MKELSVKEKAQRYDSNYEAYTELINRLEDVKNAIKEHNYGIAMDILCKPYPEFQITTPTELKESEDERIRKHLLYHFRNKTKKEWNGMPVKDILAWLEKQGEQKPVVIIPKFRVGDTIRIKNSDAEYTITEISDGYYRGKGWCLDIAAGDECGDYEIVEQTADKVKPKFKVGDRIRDKHDGYNRYRIEGVGTDYYVNGFGQRMDMSYTDTNYELVEYKSADKVEPKFHEGEWVVYECGEETATLQITRIVGETYVFSDDSTLSVADENTLRLWDITKDAKDGDVLATKDSVFIFKHKDKTGLSLCKSYCEVIGNSKLGFGFDFSINDVYPATKEQRDTLMKAMANAGYTFDFENKELKKVEQKPTTMSLDEAIEHCKEKSCGNNACALEHKQLEKWLTELKELKERSFAWSGEDSEHLDSIIESYKDLMADYKASHDVDYIPYDSNTVVRTVTDDVNFLESLKDRVQPQTAWKPSKEQIMALRWVLNHIPYDSHKEEISGLLDQIKDL